VRSLLVGVQLLSVQLLSALVLRLSELPMLWELPLQASPHALGPHGASELQLHECQHGSGPLLLGWQLLP
jgi:hypothetical protein